MCVCVCVCVLVAQSCPTPCDPVDSSLPDSSVHGILEAANLISAKTEQNKQDSEMVI